MEHKIITRELLVDGKRYFHIGCSENWKCGYSVVHEWQYLDKWTKHYEEFHKVSKLIT